MSVFNIERAFQAKKDRGWEKIFIAIDFHDTIFKGYYDNSQKVEFYPYAEQVLKYWTSREDIVLIAYTCSHAHIFESVNKWLNIKGINFDYLNENPECPNTELAAFDKKPYFNILLDDKAGFFADEDWIKIIRELQRIGEYFNYTSSEYLKSLRELQEKSENCEMVFKVNHEYTEK